MKITQKANQQLQSKIQATYNGTEQASLFRLG